MDVFETMRKRRSVRSYTAEQVPSATIDRVVQAGLLAPSSLDRKSDELVVVRNKATLEQLSACKASGARHVADADCAIVVIGDTEKSDAWIEDCCIAMTYMDLAAVEAGLGTCWVQVRLRADDAGLDAQERVRTALGIPEKYGVEAMLALGLPASNPKAHDVPLPDSERVHVGRY